MRWTMCREMPPRRPSLNALQHPRRVAPLQQKQPRDISLQKPPPLTYNFFLPRHIWLYSHTLYLRWARLCRLISLFGRETTAWNKFCECRVYFASELKCFSSGILKKPRTFFVPVYIAFSSTGKQTFVPTLEFWKNYLFSFWSNLLPTFLATCQAFKSSVFRRLSIGELILPSVEILKFTCLKYFTLFLWIA